MRFSEIVAQASELLRRKGRVSYRMLQREFALDAETLEDLKVELVEVDELAVDKDGKMLLWTGDGLPPAPHSNGQPQTETPLQAPASYTPQHLAERILAEQAAMESRGAANGERKTITALFADLKGSTALIEGLDPEDARAIIDPALQIMMDAVHRYHGYVAQALGDGIFALFGAPIAHEDHPQRALYAALRMQEEMRAYADQSRLTGGIPLQMRVGINTGEVVVRSIRKDDLHTDYVPVGHSTNLAARMEQLATPGSIVISEYTQKLVEGYFDLKALGAAEIKGVEEPLNVYEVLGAGPLRTRFQVIARRGLTRFVGRHSELDHMQQAFTQAQAGHGQIVGVMGEPGLGKSRLFYEFKQTAQSGCLVLEAFPASHGKASPYLPLLELLKTYFQIEPQDDERTRRQKVIGQVLELDRRLEDSLPYLFSLLGIDDPTSSLQQMDAQIRRQRTFEALKKLFLRESLNQPVILIFEDLHWIDTETQGFLDTLSESVASAQLLLLMNYRPEYRHEWGQKTYYTQLRLAPLGPAEAEELLTFLLGADASLTSLKSLILARTEGTPFFMEEVVQTLAEEAVLLGDRGQYQLETTPTALHISPTVQGVLAARIDRLAAEDKALLQQLAVIGRQFPLSLVKQVVSQSADELYRVLSSLQAKEFLYEQPAFPESEYLFKHALTQDVAYGTVLQEQRKALHERTAQAIEALYSSKLEDHYSELAHHYRQSGNADKAVEYLGLAGQQAQQRSANQEAVHHLTAALALLERLPDTPTKARQELHLLLSLGASLIAAQGYAADEVEHTYTRARELCLHVGEPLQVAPVLWGLFALYAVRGNHTATLPLAEKLLDLAQEQQDETLFLEAHALLGTAMLWRGEFTPGQAHLEQAFVGYDAEQRRDRLYQLGQDFGSMALVYAAEALWYRGYPDQARERVRAGLALAQALSHPFTLAEALFAAALVHQFCRESHDAQVHTEALLSLCDERGFVDWLAWGTSVQGWALVEQAARSDGRGQREAGIRRIREGLAALQVQRAELWVPTLQCPLAQAYAQDGQATEGLMVLAEGLAMVEKTAERWHEAELYRLKGELLLNAEREMQTDERQTKEEQPETTPIHQSSFISHRSEEAEACFLKALAIAQKQQAKSLELRAATSLARLWQQQGKTAEARNLLAPIYNCFTEGFDTADLKDAKALLATLSEGR